MRHEAPTDMHRYAALVPGVMEELALPHTQPEGSRLRLLPHDLNSQAQDPFCYRFPGNPQSKGVVDAVAAATEPRFPALMDVLSADEEVAQVIHTTGEHLNNNKSIWIVTPHGDILDIAYILKAAANLLDDQGYTPRRVMTIFAKSLSRMGLEMDPNQPPLETVPTMGILCHDVFLTWQRTKSSKDAINKLPKDEVARHNEQATTEMDRELSKGGVLASMAPTGTTRMKTDRHGALILPRPGRGTIELMMKDNTMVLPVPAWFKGDEKIIVAMPSNPIEISDERTVHEMLKMMAEVMTEEIEGLNFTYKMPRRRIGQLIMGAFSRQQPEAEAA